VIATMIAITIAMIAVMTADRTNGARSAGALTDVNARTQARVASHGEHLLAVTGVVVSLENVSGLVSVVDRDLETYMPYNVDGGSYVRKVKSVWAVERRDDDAKIRQGKYTGEVSTHGQ
jgi:hypothetical protein